MAKEIDDFIYVALNALSFNNTNPDGFFEKPLTEIGKELDNTINTFSFLLDGEIGDLKSNPFTTINEINMVFNKSQLLYPPNQFTSMKLKNNVYIVNPKPGDWFRFNTNNIEEGLINLKDKNKQDPDNTIKDLTIVTQKFPK
jgi:hypothetical protein